MMKSQKHKEAEFGKTMEVTAYDIAERFLGKKEVAGSLDNPIIMAWLKLDHDWPGHDEVPWCSAFLNWVCWLLQLPRTKSLRARSWLTVGEVIDDINDAQKGFDVCIFKRGKGRQPGPEVINAPGHVGLFLRYDKARNVVSILGGNQKDQVSVMTIDKKFLLGVRRLFP